MGRTFCVAAAQTGPVRTEDLAEKLPTALAMISDAADGGARILTFPELFLSPFFPNRLREDFERFFVTPDHPVIRAIVAAAAQRGLALVLPFGERTTRGLYNAALIVDGEGRALGTYRKTHIPAYFPNERPGGTGSYERLYFTPGESLPVFETAGCRFGVQICYDRQFPEASRVLALAGAEVIFMPICYATYGDPAHRAEAWEIPLRARAYENGVVVVAANKVGDEGVRRHLGRSMVVSPAGTILADAGTEAEGLVVQTIDLDETAMSRKKMPWWRDRRPELYGPIANREPERGAGGDGRR